MRETAWRTDEPCPVCETGLVLVDTGNPVLRAECRLCGYAGPFDTDGTDWDGTWWPRGARRGPSGWRCRWPARWSRTWPPSTAPACARCSCAGPRSTPATSSRS